MRILIVDDEPLVLKMIADTLRQDGHEVATAETARRGWRLLGESAASYDLIIVDGRMPRVDGWEFIMRVREDGFTGRVIVFSAYLDARTRHRYRQLEVDAMINKPPERGELLAAVRAMARPTKPVAGLRDH